MLLYFWPHSSLLNEGCQTTGCASDSFVPPRVQHRDRFFLCPPMGFSNAGARVSCHQGYKISVEAGAGAKSGIPDAAYEAQTSEPKRNGCFWVGLPPSNKGVRPSPHPVGPRSFLFSSDQSPPYQKCLARVDCNHTGANKSI